MLVFSHVFPAKDQVQKGAHQVPRFLTELPLPLPVQWIRLKEGVCKIASPSGITVSLPACLAGSGDGTRI